MKAARPFAASSNRSRWLILALVFACRAGLGFQFQSLGSVADPLIAQMGFSYAEVGTLIGLFMLPGLFLALPVGYAGRYLPDHVLVVIGLLALTAGGVLASVADGFGLLALGRIASGIGFVFTTVYFAKMVVDWFTGRELATAMGVLVTSWPFGIAMGQIGHVWLAARVDWRAAFLAASAYCAVAAVAMLLLYRSPPGAAPPGPPGEAAVLSPRALFLPRTELVLTLLAASVWGLLNGGYIVYLSFAPQVLIHGGYGAAQAAAVISLASWVMIFSASLGGQIADRSGRPDRMLYACMAAAVLALLLLPQTSFAVVLSLLFGLFATAPAGVIMALTGEAMAAQRRAFGMGVFFTVNFVMMTFAPPLAGWLFDRSGDPYYPIVLAATLFGSCILAHRMFRVAQARIAKAALPVLAAPMGQPVQSVERVQRAPADDPIVRSD